MDMTESGEVYNGLEICVPTSVDERINNWRKRFDPTYQDIEPHISLAYPPFVSYGDWQDVKPAVVACLQGFKPFRILFKEVGIFLADSLTDPNVLWLKPEDEGEIEKIRKALEKKLPNYVPPMAVPYIPHLSIGFIQDPEALQTAQKKVQSELSPIEFTVNGIVYEAQDKQVRLQFFDFIPLIG
jgi:2'-5' RNA ligase